MRHLIQQLAIEHAREAALLWTLLEAEADDEMYNRVRLHRLGMLACQRRGADPLAGFVPPLHGAELLPAAWLGPVEADPDDDEGRRAIAMAGVFA